MMKREEMREGFQLLQVHHTGTMREERRDYRASYLSLRPSASVSDSDRHSNYHGSVRPVPCESDRELALNGKGKRNKTDGSFTRVHTLTLSNSLFYCTLLTTLELWVVLIDCYTLSTLLDLVPGENELERERASTRKNCLN